MYNCSTYNMDMYKYYSSKLTLSLSKCGGRNLFGQMTVYHSGGGCRRNYSVMDFYRSMNSFGVIVGMEYDPNSSAYIALIYYMSGVFSYMTAFEGVKLGDMVFSGDALARGNSFILKFVYKFNNVFFEESLSGMCLAGSAVPLFFIWRGTMVHNVEFYPGSGAQLARAAGTYALIIKKENKKVLLRLRSGFFVYVSDSCFATMGKVLFISSSSSFLSKAGDSRHLGRSPVVRGVAMSSGDHPHGGGEGKTSGGRPSATPWGRLTKGQPTVPLSCRMRKSNVFSTSFKSLS